LKESLGRDQRQAKIVTVGSKSLWDAVYFPTELFVWLKKTPLRDEWSIRQAGD